MEQKTAVPIDADMLVKWHKRLLNLIIDIVAIIAILFIIGIFGGLLSLLGYDGMMIWFSEMNPVTERIFTTAIMVIYLFTMENFTQRTVGKYITGTMVVSEDGSKPEPRKILVRALCRIIGLEVLTFISDTPRGWHDTASDTYVVDAKKYKAALELQNSFEEIGQPQETL